LDKSVALTGNKNHKMKTGSYFIKILLFFLFALFNGRIFSQSVNKGIVQILYSPAHPVNTFIPSQFIGGAIDGHFKGDIDKMLTPANIAVMKSAGIKPVSYRLRTELAGEVWHWNPKGKWSDSIHQQGYWISDSISDEPIILSNGFRLPRRGNTHDQANDDGYSKIDDGDTATFWKSNPYLDSTFTHESNKLHPQWVIINLGKKYRINALKIKWGNPYALSYTVNYAKGNDPQYFDPFEPNIWHSFPNDTFGSDQINSVKKISGKPLPVQFIRISFSNSSYTSSQISKDIRDKLGFAIKEIEVGFEDSKGIFHDYVRHSSNHGQSVIHVSSTDSWHTSKDIDPNVEQPGIDRFFNDGLTANEPALMPMALLYGTPENMMALLKYLKRKKYPVNELEMGEEPEGQLVAPTDYGALYFQLGKKLRSVDSTIQMGGPCFASLSPEPEDSTTFTEAKWTALFLNYLKSHNRINLFSFFSFEWYPFDDLCAPSAPQLIAAPSMLSTAMKNIQNVLPEKTPIYVTEYGYSAYEGKPEVEIQGALMYADILGKFMETGGKKSFLYGYEPAFLQQSFNCGYGNNMLLGLNDSGKINYKTAAFYGTRMITHFWAQPMDSVLEIFPTECNIKNKKGQSIVSAYALRSSLGNWSVMLINKNPHKTFSISIKIQNSDLSKSVGWNPTKLIQYSKEQYRWKANGLYGHPSKSMPPVIKKINGTSSITLPPFSLTVVN
jgi:hypothetical protein